MDRYEGHLKVAALLIGIALTWALVLVLFLGLRALIS
jgi:hypothetical protein